MFGEGGQDQSLNRTNLSENMFANSRVVKLLRLWYPTSILEASQLNKKDAPPSRQETKQDDMDGVSNMYLNRITFANTISITEKQALKVSCIRQYLV